MASTPTTTVKSKRAQQRAGTGSATDELFAVSVHRIAERFRRGREESGLTLRQAAERAGLAPSTIQKIENHKIVPSIAVVVRLAHALNRRASYFIEDNHQEQTDVRLIERGQGRRLTTDDAPVAVEQIAEPLVNPRMEAFQLTIQPGGRIGGIEALSYRGAEVSTSPIVAGQTVLLGAKDGRVFGLDAQTGAIQWSFRTGDDELSGSPVVVGDTIYVASRNGTRDAMGGGGGEDAGAG